MPRVFTAYVSRFQRTRVHRARYIRGEAFTLAVNCNASLAPGAEIASIDWQVQNPNVAILGTASKTARSGTVECTTGTGGGTVVKATITADDGAVLTQLFEIGVSGQPWFNGDTTPAAGPYTVSA